MIFLKKISECLFFKGFEGISFLTDMRVRCKCDGKQDEKYEETGVSVFAEGKALLR